MKRNRVEACGCEFRMGKDLVATACGPKAARLIAEVLVVMDGTTVARRRPLRSGLVADLLDRSDALVAEVYHALELFECNKRPGPIGRAKLRRLVQQYVEIRGGVVSVKRLTDHERSAARTRAARTRARAALASDDSLNGEDGEDRE